MDKREKAAARKIGERIRQRRLELGLSMRKLGEQLGLNPSTIRRYETGGLSPEKRYLLIALADQLDTEVDWLLGQQPQQSAKRQSSLSQYTRQLNGKVGQLLHALRKTEMDDERQSLLVSITGSFIDYFATVAVYYARATRAAADPKEYGSFQKIMQEPVSGLHAMADCLLHLDRREIRQNFTLLLRSAADGRPLRRGQGSVRQRGGHWYYRFYMADENGRSIQREFSGGGSRWETETLLRQAMADYAQGRPLRSDRLTLGELLEGWLEEMRRSSRSNGTLMLYRGVVNRIKSDCGGWRLRTITTEELQQYLDSLCTGDAQNHALSAGYIRIFQVVLQGAFRYAVYPGKLLEENPMQYVVRREGPPESPLFQEEQPRGEGTVSYSQFLALCDRLSGRPSHPALLAVQIGYYTGLRIGEICALTWEDVDLEQQCVTVRRSIRYNSATHRTELSTTKRGRVRTVAFGDRLREILWTEKNTEHHYAVRCCYRVTTEQGRRYYIVEMLPAEEETDATPLDLICVKKTGAFASPNMIEKSCRKAAAAVGLDGFHFHLLRHTYTTNLLTGGASPKDVQELLGHADVATTMNVYAHSTSEAKRSSARLLDKISE